MTNEQLSELDMAKLETLASKKSLTIGEAEIVCALAPVLISTIRSLQHRVSSLENGLKPFAEASDDIDDVEDGGCNAWEHPASMNVKLSDFRCAGELLTPSPEEQI